MERWVKATEKEILALKGSELRVYLLVKMMSWKEPWEASILEIASILSESRNTIRKIVSRLKERGFLSSENLPGKKTAFKISIDHDHFRPRPKQTMTILDHDHFRPHTLTKIDHIKGSDSILLDVDVIDEYKYKNSSSTEIIPIHNNKGVCSGSVDSLQEQQKPIKFEKAQGELRKVSFEKNLLNLDPYKRFNNVSDSLKMKIYQKAIQWIDSLKIPRRKWMDKKIQFTFFFPVVQKNWENDKMPKNEKSLLKAITCDWRETEAEQFLKEKYFQEAWKFWEEKYVSEKKLEESRKILDEAEQAREASRKKRMDLEKNSKIAREKVNRIIKSHGGIDNTLYLGHKIKEVSGMEMVYFVKERRKIGDKEIIKVLERSVFLEYVQPWNFEKCQCGDYFLTKKCFCGRKYEEIQ
jgi:hypothetical protein